MEARDSFCFPKNTKIQTLLLSEKSSDFVVVVRPKGFEPPAPGVGGQCSIQLSYGRLCMKNAVTAYFNLVK